MREQEIAIIGPTEMVKPFLALNIHCHEFTDPLAAENLLKKMAQEQKIGIIFIAENLAEKLMPTIEKIKARELPAIFILPEYGSAKRLGLKRLENVMSRAIGKKI